MTTWAEILRTGLVEQDEAVLALAKPAGVSVMGERHGTDLVDLARAAGQELFPVHRIDKVTSGLVLFARSIAVHGPLTRQFALRTVDKAYLVVTATAGLPAHGRIDLPLGVGRKGRVRIAAAREDIRSDPAAGRWWVDPQHVTGPPVYPSTTEFDVLWTDGRLSVLQVRPVTGRRHQIRVHLAWVGHPILGDPLFRRADVLPAARTYLHSWRLALDATWRDGERLTLRADPPPDFWTPVDTDPAILPFP